MKPFKIDKEFENKIPPIGEDEFKQLEDNIVQAGEVYEALTVWKEEAILVDGHNRWKIIQKHPDIKYTVREMSFSGKWAAFEWMYKNQLGRRNLTDEQRTYMIGKMYEARKQSQGGNREMQHDENGRFTASSQNGALRNGKTSIQIAKEIGVGQKTVERAEKFTKGVDALREVSPEAADKVLSGKAKVTKTEIQEVPKMEPEQVKAAADAILSDMAVKPKPDKPKPDKPKGPGYTKADRELHEIIQKSITAQTNYDAPSTYNIDDLIQEIEINGNNYINSLKNTLEHRKDIVKDADAKNRVSQAISKIIQDIVKVRGEFIK